MAITFASQLAHQPVKDYIRKKGHLLIEVPPLRATYDAADGHTDLYVHPLVDAKGKKHLFHAPQIKPLLDQAGITSDTEAVTMSRPLQSAYPGNIPLNAVSTSKFFIHNLKYTDPALLTAAEAIGLTLVNVRQGYTKCSVAVVSDDAFITSDRGIVRALAKHNCSVLEISPGSVLLPGLPAGFLGGACGLLEGELIFNGDLALHPDHSKLLEFCSLHQVKTRWFDGYPLMDIGSIVTI